MRTRYNPAMADPLYTAATAFERNDFAAGIAAARQERMKPGMTPAEREALARLLLTTADKAWVINAWIESYKCAQEAYLAVNGLPKGGIRDEVLQKWQSIHAALHDIQFNPQAAGANPAV